MRFVFSCKPFFETGKLSDFKISQDIPVPAIHLAKNLSHQYFFWINEIYRRLLLQNQTYMKRKILLFLVMASFITAAHAQKKQSNSITGYAITAQQKGGKSWKEVRLVDITTGSELKSIYQSTQEMQALNARTGKPVMKKDITPGNAKTAIGEKSVIRVKKSVNLDMELDKANGAAPREIRILRSHS